MAQLQSWAPREWPVAQGWGEVVDNFLDSAAGAGLGEFIQARLDAGAVIYPPQPFRALELTALDQVRAVIVGQDPYHGPGQAEGLAFSVAPGVKLPPSLRNIFKELGHKPANGSLAAWAARGVLLLNTSLTVEDGQAGSHAKKGWEMFTDELLAKVGSTASPCVYLLWGAHAQARGPRIRQAADRAGREALILQSSHPSPLSASRLPVPFVGCGHFRTADRWLAERGHAKVFEAG